MRIALVFGLLLIALISLSDFLQDMRFMATMWLHRSFNIYTSHGSLFLKDGLINTNIFFLHFPKAGTTFAHTVLYTQTNCQHLVESSKQAATCCIHLNWAKCVERYNLSNIDYECCRSIGGLHKPLIKDRSFKVTVIRDPYNRIISAYYYGYNYYNPDKDNSKMKEYNDVRLNYLNIAYNQTKSNEGMSMALYASSYANSNCYTKMLLGQFCNAPFPIGSYEAAEAKRRLESFDFIAITERWAESICLYHKVLKIQKPIDWSFQGVKIRSGKYNYSRNSLLVNYVHHNMKSDVELYAAATEIFGGYLELFPECSNEVE